MRVVIVGGGVAGLALANALEKADIDYVLLEGRTEIAPFIGASVAMTANGFRILDQLGCADIILNATYPLEFVRTWGNKDGRLVSQWEAFLLSHKRSGYPLSFMDRHFLLKTLYDNIEDKSKVLLDKKVSRVDHSTQGVSVQCKDGTTYAGDIVIGTDGVHSIVRNEMWRHMDIAQPGLPTKERTLMSAEYKCMYGVARPIPGREGDCDPNYFHRCVGQDISFMWSPAKDGRIFWFVYEKLDKVYHAPDIPKFTDQDALDLAQHGMDLYISDKLKFSDVWENRIAYMCLPLEEAFYEHWSYGRIACIGDTVHKWTPNLGAGANHAIEDAAALASAIYKLAHSKTPPDHKTVEAALSNVRESRKFRAEAMSKATNKTTRLEAIKGPMESLLTYYIAPWFLADFIANRQTTGNVGAEKLEYLPDPPQSLLGTQAFNPTYRTGKKPSLLGRVIPGIPLLLLAYFASTIFSNIVQLPTIGTTFHKVLPLGQLEYHGQIWNLPTMASPLSVMVTFFSPSLLNVDPLQRLQMITFITDLAPLWLIWIFESHRPANVMTFAWWPVIFGVAFQLKGIGMVGPIWFFLHYIQSPLRNYSSLDWRMVNVAAAKTALVAMLATLVVPTFAMYFTPDLDQRLQINVMWQVFPFFTVVFHYLLRKLTVSDTTRVDRLYNVHADLPYVRFAVYTLSAISALTFNWVRFTSTASIASLMIPDWNVVNALLRAEPVGLDFPAATKVFLQVDEVVCFGAAFVWLALLVRDLKKAEMTTTAWWKIVVSGGVGTVLIGPGAVVALAWLWRDEMLATKKAKGSVGDTYVVDKSGPTPDEAARWQKFLNRE
ncbi:hypothetical protein LTR10_017448 [Elasticomyces elasticus]|uniref:FAD-binding domain-containing protein n=1 Tax=Exophiala sideris TaxID=1016849 RepID=A0ABR0JAH1_9EURO|nr:hypothetical protein LTR10_017448 [Elasticomyces elasticus]KAK5030370.1 hypothetical protein LTS07_005154 [Exophiala sideris]KAK5038423.1 hypothetical protein LTR13_004170 [Exophiala sideris]KAK5060306.1 hypothetical protein LTR69_005623 [Exophiala sideris]KAK5183217.1 hypothetical protein LTR44_004218 [Eurotiomycetes sp. CCFEE 6388]